MNLYIRRREVGHENPQRCGYADPQCCEIEGYQNSLLNQSIYWSLIRLSLHSQPSRSMIHSQMIAKWTVQILNSTNPQAVQIDNKHPSFSHTFPASAHLIRCYHPTSHNLYNLQSWPFNWWAISWMIRCLRNLNNAHWLDGQDRFQSQSTSGFFCYWVGGFSPTLSIYFWKLLSL